MKLIELENKKYTYKADLKDFNLFEYFKFVGILYEREKIKKDEFVDGEVLYEEVEIGKESEEFILQRKKNVLKFISNLPESVYNLSKTQFNEVYRLIEQTINLDFKTLKSPVKSQLNGVDWYKLEDKYETELYCPEPNILSFQEFADIDNKISQENPPLILAFLLRGKIGEKYDRFHYKFRYTDKVDFLSGISVIDGYNLLKIYIDFITSVKETYTYIWGNHPIPNSQPSPNYEKFASLVGWENTIGLVAESGVFGQLNEVRNASYYEVLDYLNVKRGREIAEARDYAASQKRMQQKK